MPFQWGGPPLRTTGGHPNYFARKFAMTWKPMTAEGLAREIQESEAQLSDIEATFWNLVKVVPQKWQLHPWGDDGGGFWVVAIFGNQVIYYNDIEDGFNTSIFSTLGTIDEYWCNDDELHTLLHNLLAR
jgi:hypothetical protein